MRRNRYIFLVASFACWMSLSIGLYVAFDLILGLYMSNNSLHRILLHAATLIAFALLQRQLLARFYGFELQHWLRWTLVGVIVSAICSLLYAAAAPAPSEFWWHARVSPPPSELDQFMANAYYAVRWFFRFGLVAFFPDIRLAQRFAQPPAVAAGRDRCRASMVCP